MEWLELVIALGVILAGAELFTNGVEWVGEGLGLSEGVVGSVLAAIGTALPETLLPVVAILLGHEHGDEIGIGAILGAPFMLATLAMFALGLTVVIYAKLGRRPAHLEHNPGVLTHDLGYFLIVYALATIAGAVHVRVLHYVLAAALLVGYGLYVRRHIRSPGEKVLEREAVGEVKPLHAGRLLRKGTNPRRPSVSLSTTQTLVGLLIIVGGARIFVLGISALGDRLHVSHLAFALLLAPIATELPEALNSSVIWARRGKDVLALGNITGAMVFQGTFPVAVGLLFTPWRLTGLGSAAALVAIAAGGVLYLSAKLGGQLVGRVLLVQGVFYVGYVIFVVTRI